MVVVVAPILDDDASFEQVGEGLDVEAFVSLPAVGRLDPAVRLFAIFWDDGGLRVRL